MSPRLPPPFSLDNRHDPEPIETDPEPIETDPGADVMGGFVLSLRDCDVHTNEVILLLILIRVVREVHYYYYYYYQDEHDEHECVIPSLPP